MWPVRRPLPTPNGYVLLRSPPALCSTNGMKSGLPGKCCVCRAGVDDLV